MILVWLSGIFSLFLVILGIKAYYIRTKNLYVKPVEKISFSSKVVEKFAEAIRFPTISDRNYENWNTKAFQDFHSYLEEKFPLVHTHLKRERVEEFGLLYTWSGRNPKLKPILLMAHQDVVSVEEGTENEWHYPPFSGAIQEGFIWGRGTLDIKCVLISILEAVEWLLQKGFSPTRTVYLAYGFDEEVGGKRGAKEIACLLENRGVELEYILDEGGSILQDAVDGLAFPVATIGITEKGYLSLELVVNSPGGHSSMPYKENATGILARAIDKIEKYSFPSKLHGVSALFFKKIAPYMGFWPRLVMSNLWLFGGVLKKYLAHSPITNASIRTTAVVTMLEASSQDNVLPQRAKAVVNIRIFPGESVESVKKYLQKIIHDPRVQIVQTERWEAVDPAPISPVDVFGYQIIEKTIYQIFPNVIVAPCLMIGLTDSRHYQRLTRNIYRFAPVMLKKQDLPRVHGSNERIGVEEYKNLVRFYIQLLQNSCE